jgi:hypothetical protein
MAVVATTAAERRLRQIRVWLFLSIECDVELAPMND